MPIVFSEHAVIQIKQRAISKISVIKAVKDPDSITKSFRTRRLRDKLIGSKILRVITVTEGSKISIVTAYYLK